MLIIKLCFNKFNIKEHNLSTYALIVSRETVQMWGSVHIIYQHF